MSPYLCCNKNSLEVLVWTHKWPKNIHLLYVSGVCLFKLLVVVDKAFGALEFCILGTWGIKALKKIKIRGHSDTLWLYIVPHPLVEAEAY